MTTSPTLQSATVLEETREIREKSLREIRNWLENNPQIGAKDDDLSILAFLRGCKYNLDKTKAKIKNYYAMRKDVPEWYSNRDPNLQSIQELVRLGVFVPLRRLHQNKHVVIIKTAAHNPKKHQQDDVLKTGMMILDLLGLNNETLQIHGIIAIFDMKGISLGHAKQMTVSRIKKIVYSWRNYHCRPKQFEFINAPDYISVVLNIFKQFMSEKLKNRIRVHFHGHEKLLGVIDKDVLPVEYGGTDGSLQEQIDFWANRLMEYTEWFREDEKFKSTVD